MVTIMQKDKPTNWQWLQLICRKTNLLIGNGYNQYAKRKPTNMVTINMPKENLLIGNGYNQYAKRKPF